MQIKLTKPALNIVLLSYADQDGGAAIACGRLAKALKSAGHRVTWLVEKREGHPVATQLLGKKSGSWLRFVFERLYFWLFEKNPELRFLFNPGVFGRDLHRHPVVQQADIVHLHWVNFGFLGISHIQQLLALGKPVFWTLHDMWAFTGGCHHSGTCLNYEIACGNCDFLKQPGPRDLSHRLLEKKIKAFDAPNLYPVTCSHWLLEKLQRSRVMQQRKAIAIPNPLDLSLFFPRDKAEAKKDLGLDPQKKYLLFAAARLDAPKKGWKELLRALDWYQSLYPEDQVELLLMGQIKNGDALHGLGLPYHSLGHLNPNQVVAYYQAADAYVHPSLEENLPNTIMEAMACGTPCVGFAVGGIPEMIASDRGALVPCFEEKTMAEALHHVLENSLDLGKHAAEFVRNRYEAQAIAQQYEQAYRQSLAHA